MAKQHGKRYRALAEKIERGREYRPDEAAKLIKETSQAKFDTTVELHLRMGVDPKHADQMVRGAAVLPNGTGKKVRVIAFAQGEKAREAQAAGADAVGADDLAKRIEGGWLDFDVAVATPDLMGQVGRLGRVLGPRGLMPNPKSGTVTFDVGKAVRDAKGGRVDRRHPHGRGQVVVHRGTDPRQPRHALRRDQPGPPGRRQRDLHPRGAPDEHAGPEREARARLRERARRSSEGLGLARVDFTARQLHSLREPVP